MDSLRDLYQETILDHYKRPRNHAAPAGANAYANGHNPLCGDKLTVYLELDGETVKAAGFSGGGCAIATASASLMTDAVKGKSCSEAGELFEKMHTLLTTDQPAAGSLGKLAVFEGVREFPARVKCASLAWQTLRSALKNSHETVKTE